MPAAEKLKQGGRLQLAQLLRSKTKYFTSGFAIGSKLYMEKVLSTLGQQGQALEERKGKSTILKHVTELKLRTLRNLQKDPVEVK